MTRQLLRQILMLLTLLCVYSAVSFTPVQAATCGRDPYCDTPTCSSGPGNYVTHGPFWQDVLCWVGERGCCQTGNSYASWDCDENGNITNYDCTQVFCTGEYGPKCCDGNTCL